MEMTIGYVTATCILPLTLLIFGMLMLQRHGVPYILRAIASWFWAAAFAWEAAMSTFRAKYSESMEVVYGQRE